MFLRPWIRSLSTSKEFALLTMSTCNEYIHGIPHTWYTDMNFEKHKVCFRGYTYRFRNMMYEFVRFEESFWHLENIKKKSADPTGVIRLWESICYPPLSPLFLGFRAPAAGGGGVLRIPLACFGRLGAPRTDFLEFWPHRGRSKKHRFFNPSKIDPRAPKIIKNQPLGTQRLHLSWIIFDFRDLFGNILHCFCKTPKPSNLL